jgi:hypothetical protein
MIKFKKIIICLPVNGCGATPDDSSRDVDSSRETNPLEEEPYNWKNVLFSSK